MERSDVHFVPDVAAAALTLFEATMLDAVALRGRFVVNLSGGSTPRPLYEALAGRSDLPWERTVVVWGDERYLPHDHPRSNVGSARAALLDRVPVPARGVLPWPYRADLDAEGAAAAYARTLRATLGDPPVFDLTLLGLGDDGHTASLFPGSGAVFAEGLTLALQPAGQPEPRLSMTPAALSRSRVVAFLVAGEGKRAALAATLAGDGDLDRYPARALSALERLRVLTDLDPPI